MDCCAFTLFCGLLLTHDIHDILESGNAIAKEKTNLILQTVKEAIFK